MTIIDLLDITCVRGDTTILSRVSWRIERGRHQALLGANGSGKTTLLKIVTGYEWPTEGEVHVLGERFGDCNLPELRKTIGWVSSAIMHQFPPNSTAMDVTVSGIEASMGLYRDMSDAEWRRASAALARVGLESIGTRPYRLLSQGEQQRVLIARALVSDPALLILDEPCAGLDPMAREAFLQTLEDLARARDAPTMLMVTHHIEEIGPWISDVFVLKGGRRLAAGPKEEILTSAVLSDAFDGHCEVERSGDRFYLAARGAGST